MVQVETMKFRLVFDMVEGTIEIAAAIAWVILGFAVSESNSLHVAILILACFMAVRGFLLLVPDLIQPHLTVGEDGLELRPRWRFKPMRFTWDELLSCRGASPQHAAGSPWWAVLSCPIGRMSYRTAVRWQSKLEDYRRRIGRS